MQFTFDNLSHNFRNVTIVTVYKMSLRLPLFVCLLFVLLMKQSNGFIEPSKVTLLYDEQPCLAIGGKCTETEMDCPADTHINTKGLCPRQQDRGVECCHSVLRKIDTCQSFGGICVDSSFNCLEQLMYKNPEDCKATNTTCCILF